MMEWILKGGTIMNHRRQKKGEINQDLYCQILEIGFEFFQFE